MRTNFINEVSPKVWKETLGLTSFFIYSNSVDNTLFGNGRQL